MPRRTSPSNRRAALVAGRYELVHQLRGVGETIDWEGFDAEHERPVLVQLLRPELVHDSVATERFWQVARAGARRAAIAVRRVIDARSRPDSGQLLLGREGPASP